MTFLSLGIEKSCLTQQKDLLEFEEMSISNNLNETTEELADYLELYEEDSYTASLEAQQELYDSKKASIESQLEAINAEIESYEKAVSTNVKSECKLQISV